MAFVRTFGCCVPGCGRKSQAHHAGKRAKGMGIKGSDFLGVPLCDEHHAELDRPGCGPESFQEKYGVRFSEVQATLLHRWITGEWGDLVLSPCPQ